MIIIDFKLSTLLSISSIYSVRMLCGCWTWIRIGSWTLLDSWTSLIHSRTSKARSLVNSSHSGYSFLPLLTIICKTNVLLWLLIIGRSPYLGAMLLRPCCSSKRWKYIYLWFPLMRTNQMIEHLTSVYYSIIQQPTTSILIPTGPDRSYTTMLGLL